VWQGKRPVGGRGAHLFVESSACEHAAGIGNGTDTHEGGGAAECVCHSGKAQGCSLREGASHRVAALGLRRNGQARSCHYGINLCALAGTLRERFRRGPGAFVRRRVC
jgi:hypothetical protein